MTAETDKLAMQTEVDTQTYRAAMVVRTLDARYKSEYLKKKQYAKYREKRDDVAIEFNLVIGGFSDKTQQGHTIFDSTIQEIHRTSVKQIIPEGEFVYVRLPEIGQKISEGGYAPILPAQVVSIPAGI